MTRSSPVPQVTSRLVPPSDADGGAVPLVRNRQIWVLVAIVVFLAAVWEIGVAATGRTPTPGAVDFVPLGLFLVPVLYAAVNLGLSGGVTVAAVAAVVTLPWIGVTLVNHDPIGAWFDSVQASIMLVVAFFVGRGVTAEREARLAAEDSRQAHLAAEVRYHDLFETNSEPILLVDEVGTVHEANTAAADLFVSSRRPLAGKYLGELIGPSLAKSLLDGEPVAEPSPMPEETTRMPESLYLPVISPTTTMDGQRTRQIVLRDMTEEARRRLRVEAYASHVLQGQEEERRRISQELHDGPLQTLIHLCRQIDAVGETPASADVLAAGAARSQGRDPGTGGRVQLDDLRSLAEFVVDEIRGISRGLRPPLLDDLGLEAALQRLFIEVERRGDVHVTLAVTGRLPVLSPAVELTIYRIAQESLSNALRHAGATEIAVQLTIEVGQLQFSVSDNGGGFEASTAHETPSHETSGLTGMFDRAELVGGKLGIRSGAGSGTIVTLEIPTEMS